MLFTPLQLKEKLLGALDEDNNVVDTAVVLEVITILEKFPITREALEQTRIGRHVNELRKKTTNEELAKRAKRLVRGWQRLLTFQDGSSINGDSTSTPPQHRNISVLQSTGNGSKPSSPTNRSPAINKHITQVRLSPAISGSRPVTPTSLQADSIFNKPGNGSNPNKSTVSPGLLRNVNTSNLKSSFNSPNESVNLNTPDLQISQKSPALSSTRPPSNQTKAETSGKNVKLLSPKVKPSTLCQSPQLTSSKRPVTPIESEDSLTNADGSCSSINRNNGTGRLKNKKNKLSPCKKGKVKVGKKSNHSTESSTSQNSDNCPKSDQSGVSKADIANRKRSRLGDHSVPPVKQAKFDFADHSLSSKQPLNGKVYSKQASDKAKHNAFVNNSAIYDSLRSCESPASLSDCSTPSNKKNRQENLKLAPSVKTPKVKTTAELIAELQQKTGSASYGNDILEKLRTKQIEHEADVPASVLPPGIRPRKKRKSSSSLLSVPSSSLSETKTELVQKFLQTSLSPTSADWSSHIDYFPIKSESPPNSSHNTRESIIVPHLKTKEERVQNVALRMQESSSHVSEIPKVTIGASTSQDHKRLTIEEIDSQLPPIDFDNINWDCSDYVMPVYQPVNDLDILRIHNENWPGINGRSDHNDTWHDWASTLTLPSYDDEPLHILPYVIVDD